MNHRQKLILATVFIVAAVAGAGSIKVWSTGEYITSTDMNANFAHIHNQMVGGHGARLVNADVSGSAAIAHSKLATPALLPKTWVAVDVCAGVSDGGAAVTCSFLDSSNVTSVSATSTGIYLVTYPTRGSSNYGSVVSARGTSSSSYCVSAVANATTSNVYCFAAGVATNSTFTFMLLDSSN